MNIPIRWLARSWDVFCEWGNVAIWKRGRFELRRLDILITFWVAFGTAYYGWANGWRGAVFGFTASVLMLVLGLVLRR